MDKALGELIKVAAELVLCRELPDVYAMPFRPMGKRAIRAMESKQNDRARRIKRAVDEIRKHMTSEQSSDE